MRKIAVMSCVLGLACGVQASWYWPFESEVTVVEEQEPPRISELMEPASELIDKASDFAADGEIEKSVEAYRAALMELDRVERENPERAKSAEFATVRNKRAYVNAAIDSMLLRQIKQNAKAVAVSDTTELERKLAEERGEKKVKVEGEGEEEKAKSKVEKKSESEVVVEQRRENSTVRLPTTTTTEPPAPKPTTRREQAIDAIAKGDYVTAEGLVKDMLAEKPNGAMALNLRAAMEMKQGKLDVAEETLDQAIMSNPRNYSAYYNMAMLLLQKGVGNKASAKRYYETGRAMGGPENANLEALVK